MHRLYISKYINSSRQIIAQNKTQSNTSNASDFFICWIHLDFMNTLHMNTEFFPVTFCQHH